MDPASQLMQSIARTCTQASLRDHHAAGSGYSGKTGFYFYRRPLEERTH